MRAWAMMAGFQMLSSGFLWAPMVRAESMTGALRTSRTAPADMNEEGILEIIQKTALPDLIQSISTRPEKGRFHLTQIDGVLQDSRATPYLLQAYVNTTEEGLRCKLLESLGKLHDPSLLNWFVKRLNDPSIGIQCFAIWALGELRSRHAVSPLKGKLWSTNRFVQMTAMDAIGKSGPTPEVAEDLILFLNDRDVQIRYIAAKSLSGPASRDVLPAMMNRLLMEPSVDVQDILARTLGQQGGAVVAGRFIELLKISPIPATEHWAELGLASGEPGIVIPLVTPLLSEADTRLRISAARILRGFGRRAQP